MTQNKGPDLTPFRQQIDAIDDQIIKLMCDRTAIVKQVGETKRAAQPGRCPIRAGREADMIRRMVKEFSGTLFAPAAAAHMWRGIITASLAVESDMTVSAYAPSSDTTLYWLSREYFGNFTPITQQPHTRYVISDVLDKTSAVGVLPTFHNSQSDDWWTHLMHQENAPKIFAVIPFVYSLPVHHQEPQAFAISCISPEDTGNDTSIIGLETDHDLSQNRLIDALKKSGLDATWLRVVSPSPDIRQHLISIPGFIAPNNTKLKDAIHSLGHSVRHSVFLGAYANPVEIKKEEKNDAE